MTTVTGIIQDMESAIQSQKFAETKEVPYGFLPEPSCVGRIIAADEHLQQEVLLELARRFMDYRIYTHFIPLRPITAMSYGSLESAMRSIPPLIVETLRPLAESLGVEWRDASAAASWWAGNLDERKGTLDPEAYAIEVAERARMHLDLVPIFRRLVDQIVDAAGRVYSREVLSPAVVVIGITVTSARLLAEVEMLRHPGVVYLVCKTPRGAGGERW